MHGMFGNRERLGKDAMRVCAAATIGQIGRDPVRAKYACIHGESFLDGRKVSQLEE